MGALTDRAGLVARLREAVDRGVTAQVYAPRVNEELVGEAPAPPVVALQSECALWTGEPQVRDFAVA